ncbi:MAG: glycosyltransferase family 4 protein [Geminocystis sp.]|nr:glycosyltransferase family 4 protein [Geminocystis sp.]
MRILVDCTCVRPPLSGVGYYTHTLIKALRDLVKSRFPEWHLALYRQPSLREWLTGKPPSPSFPQQGGQMFYLPLPVNVSSLLGKHAAFFAENLGDYFDVVHGTDHYVYPFRRGKKLITIHDLAFVRYPEYCHYIVRISYENRIKKCLEWTDLVLTFSQITKKEIVDYFQIPEEKVVVTSEASRYDSNYLDSVNVAEVKRKYHHLFAQPYILFVGTMEPRKNIINLVKAFNLIKKEFAINHNLVLIGKKGWQYREILAEIENSPYRNNIKHLGYLTEEEVAVFYANAEVFVYPSLYEGFGLPILEAMTLGAPVVTSRISALPEVAGEAALYIPPHDWQAMAYTVYRVIQDRDLREKLKQLGKLRGSLYSWQRVAEETLHIYSSLGHSFVC